MKTCTKCGVEKPRTEYARSTRDGINAACRECERARKRKYWNENSRTLLQQQRKYREENRWYFVDYKRRTREKRAASREVPQGHLPRGADAAELPG